MVREIRFISTLTFLLLTIIIFSIYAGVPTTMNYQGRLTDSTGNPVTDTTHDIIFKIYNETDSVLWEESHSVNTTDGFFSVQLGSNGSPLTSDIFDHTERWLGITVDADPEITPRTQLNTVPYAFKTSDVQSSDIINEPGVAAFSGAYYVYLEDQAYTKLCSLSIACPAEGYVMAVAHGRIATLPQHTEGIKSYAIVGISDNPTSVPGNQDLDFQIDSVAPSGVYSIPFGMTSMFTVDTTGSYTYYYLAYEYSGSVSVADMQFNLIYFPTAYGIVDPVPPPVKATDDNGTNWMDGFGPIEYKTEDTSITAPDITQLEKELVALKAKIDSLQKQIDKIKSDD
jgi:hypothetical protein